MPLLQLHDAALAFGHVPLLDGVNLVIEKRERLCLIGRNGTGKSSLLNVISGQLPLDSGQIWRADGLRIAKLDQDVPDGATESLFEVVAGGLGDHSDVLGRYHTASLRLADGDEAALEAFSKLQAEVEALGAWEGSQRVDAMLSRLALPADALLRECSGGVRRRAMLARALVSDPDLLLLDEPTNHLDIDSIQSLEDALLNHQGAVLFITHDRSLIDAMATRIIELDRGQLRSFPGNYAGYLQRKEAQLAAEADQDRKFDQNLAKEEAWIRQGIKARRTRNEGRVRRLESLRAERAARLSQAGRANLRLERGEASGNKVLEVEKVSFGYADETLIAPFSTLIMRGDRVGIIGRNGSGKSTLLGLLLGHLAPSSGTVTRGTRLEIAYFDQERAQLDLERSVRDNVAEGSDTVQIGGRSKHVISYLGDFLFPPARVNSPVKTLSGGERNRLLLAKLFVKPSNLLVLDEPTNDLDIDTLELLEALLSEYDGTLLVVSHDRSFLDRTVTSTLSIDIQGQVHEHIGGYSDWLREQQRQASDIAQAKSSEAAGPSIKPTRAKAKRKLRYKDQRELDGLPERIEVLEQQLEQQQQAANDAEFFEQPADTVNAHMQKMAETQQQLDGAYERWQALEALARPSET